VNGDEVRATRFASTPVHGYDASQVDDLLRRVAAELDAGRSPEPLLRNVTFQVKGWWDAFPLTLAATPPTSRYDIDAVDWFLGQFSLRASHAELAEMGADPWRDLAVAQLTQDVGSAVAKPSLVQLLDLDKLLDLDTDLSGECWNAWRAFGGQPGVYLREGRAGHWWAPRHELRAAEQQTIASRGSGWTGETTVRVGGSSFTYRRVGPWPPGAAEIAARSARDCAGHFAAETMSETGQEVRELVDETGTPILYTSGKNYARRACACVTFPDQRRLRFLVRGTKPENAIMTAVDQAGNRVARYRQFAEDFDPYRVWGEVVITVHPDQKLTDELVLAIAISTTWLDSYFRVSTSKLCLMRRRAAP
jgi:DivIVA domain-containing protein